MNAIKKLYRLIASPLITHNLTEDFKPAEFSRLINQYSESYAQNVTDYFTQSVMDFFTQTIRDSILKEIETTTIKSEEEKL